MITPQPKRKQKPNPIRIARERAGLSREQAAARASLSVSTLRNAERAGLISERTATKLAPVLGVDPAALLAGAA